MKETIKIEELKQGDILLFSHTDEWDSKLISLITNSPVSHAAMSYYDYSQIVEETPPCAVVNELEQRKTGREITVMRLKNDEDMTKVLDIAKKYVEEKEPYGNANLIFIFVYLLFEKAAISVKLQRLLCTLIKFILSELIKLLDDVFRKGTHPMVCSQFVYNCYMTAGDEYRLKIWSKSGKNNILNKIKDYIEENKESLHEILNMNITKIEEEHNCALEINKEELLKSMYEELILDSKTGSLISEENLEEDFVILVCKFLLLLSKLYNRSRGECNDNINNIINDLCAMEEYFVTPGDLLVNCDNLQNIGVLE